VLRRHEHSYAQPRNQKGVAVSIVTTSQNDWRTARFHADAAAFEAAYERDDWSLLEPNSPRTRHPS
jgi:hypothetical protein